MIKCERCGGSVKSPKMMTIHLDSCPSPIPRYRKKNDQAPDAPVGPKPPISEPAPIPVRKKRVIPRY